MTISEIKKLPTTFKDAEKGDCHESILRSFQIMKKVEKMLKRGDSNDTILEIIQECYGEQP